MDNKNQLYIFPFSARSREALDNILYKVIDHLRQNSRINLADASWTLQKGRRVLEYKKAVIANRTDMIGNTFHVCGNGSNILEKKPNLVFMLPEMEDTASSWKAWHEESYSGCLFEAYQHAAETIVERIPDQYAVKIASATDDDLTTLAFRALIRGYASFITLEAIGVNPSALSGEGIAELTAMVCAGAVCIEDAIDMIVRYGVLFTYEEKYENYQVKNKQIPIMRRAGEKAKEYLEKAVVVKLSSNELQNNITKLCMPAVDPEYIISLIGDDGDSFMLSFCLLIGKLWCFGIDVSWDMLNQDLFPRRVSLPAYVFEKKKFDSDVVFGSRMGEKQDTSPFNTILTEKSGENASSVLKELWQDILGITDIKTSDDFFEYGGSSLDAIMLSAKIKERLKIDFPLSYVFHNSTFGRMEKYIREHLNDRSEDFIKKLGNQKYYEASGAQKRMYIMNELIKDALPYNFAAVYRIDGEIDKAKLQNCFSRMVQRHEAFRTRFEMVNGDVVQIIEQDVDFQVKYSDGLKENMEQQIRSSISAFNLSRAPLLRVMVISFTSREHILILDMHHIISDQSSLAVLLKELRSLYEGGDLPELEIQYKDFAKWQNDFFRSGEADQQLEYWKSEFAGGIPVLELYTDFDRPETIRFEGGSMHFDFDEELSQQIVATAKQQGITPYMFLMAALKILLWRYTNQNEIVVGTAVAGRKHVQLEPIVGMFVNTLAIKSKIDEELTVQEYLQYMKEKMLRAFDNQDCQFDLLVEALDIAKNNSRNPLFDVALNYINMGTEEPEIEGLSLTPYEDGKLDVKYDITFILEERDQKFELDIEYLKSLFRSETIKLMGNRLVHVISWMLNGCGRKLKEVSLITESERQWLVDTVNQIAVDCPPDQTILSVFEQNVRKYPDKIALEELDEHFTYSQLNSLTNQLADHLKQLGCGYGDYILILLERGYMQIVSMLGIMKLGAVYVPMDSQYPQERINYILEDSKSKVVITSRVLGERIGKDVRKYLIDAEENRLDLDLDNGIESVHTPAAFNNEDLLFILYTSGSTGQPKGTCVMHKNILRVVKYNNFITANENDRVVQMSNYVFDPSMFDFFTTLLNGATLVLVPMKMTIDIPALADFLQQKGITLMCLSTALFHMLVDWKAESMKDIRKILVGGEQMSLHHARKAVRVLGKGRIINGYGPTETGIMATGYPVDDVEDISIVPIGYPVTNTKIYVVDEKQQLTPMNVAGELYIGGEAVSRGYLNQEALTGAKFTSFAAAGGERVFCSGDRVVWNSRGELVFLGRKDFQVKVRGYRIELGEVERYVENVEGVQKAFVVTEKDNLDTLYMIAYYTISDYSQKERFNESYLQDALSGKLPEYMIPSKYLLLEAFPLNHNGKIDKKALPKIAGYEETMEVKAYPRDELEALLMKTMKKVLNVGELDVNDDFFRCGGQSIKAIALARELSDHGLAVTVNDIFQYPTAEKLAGLLRGKPQVIKDECPENRIELNEKQVDLMVRQITSDVPGASELITMLDSKQMFSLSSMQKVHLLAGSDYSGFVHHIEGQTAEHKIKAVIAKVICDNQLLHCSMKETEEGPKWCEYELAETDAVLGDYLAYRDISRYVPASQAAIINGLYHQIILHPYTAGQLLWRLCILKMKEDGYLLIWGSDHLIFDGMSAQVIKNQIDGSLRKEQLPLPERYSDYVKVLKQGPVMEDQELAEQFQLAAWSEANQKIMEQLAENEIKLNRQVKLVLPLAKVEPSDIWMYAFELVAEILKDYTKSDVIPFAVVDYGRSYQEQHFYNCVGEFLAMVPIIYDKNNKIPVESTIQLCKDYSVNFVTLLEEETLKLKYPAVTEMLGRYFFNDKRYYELILYNFQGDADKEDKAAFADIQDEEYMARITVIVNYDADYLYIELHNLSEKDEEKMLYYAEKRGKGEKQNEE